MSRRFPGISLSKIIWEIFTINYALILLKAVIVIFIIMLSMIIFISKTIHDFEQKIAKIISERMRYFHLDFRQGLTPGFSRF